MNKEQAQKLMTMVNEAITEVVTIIDDWDLENDRILANGDLDPIYDSLTNVERWLGYAKDGIKKAVRKQRELDEDQPF